MTSTLSLSHRSLSHPSLSRKASQPTTNGGCPTAIGGHQLVNSTIAAVGAAADRRAVDVTRRVESEVTWGGIRPIRASPEAIKHRFGPTAECRATGCRRGFQIEQRAAATSAATASSSLVGRTVQSAVPADNDSGFGISPVIAPLEAVKGRENPAGAFVR